ncbi:MAG TPA: transcriptional activator NhaR [Longimicrobiales bacterium]
MRRRNINYHHLRYFWVVAHEGTITGATRHLHLTQPAISAQLRKLERSLGEKLFEKSGRNLVLTEAGKIVLRYADEIFVLGHELTETLAGRPTGKPMRFRVGIAEVVPKLLIQRLLAPALRLKPAIHLVVQEDRQERLLVDLAAHELDMILTDAPVTNARSTVFNHPLGECGVTVFGTPALAASLRSGFPGSLEGVPMLVPTPNSALRRALDDWFETQGIQPRIVAEIEDSAVLKVFGQSGAGIFAAPSAIEPEIKRQYRVVVIGRLNEIRERFYAITAERRIKHPAVLAVTATARERLFAREPKVARKPNKPA